jgi:predicted GIY-YIG superfamily endonuclease
MQHTESKQMTTQDLGDRPHGLYRFFDHEGVLLYVGITVNLPTRLASHADEKPWWTNVARMTVEYHPSRDLVLDAERLAIATERPLHNVQHNRRAGSIPRPISRRQGGPQLPGWTYMSRASGYTRTGPFWLDWEASCDPISEDFYVDEITAVELWREWRRRYPVDRGAEAVYGKGAVAIHWFVGGACGCEAAPFADVRALQAGMALLGHRTADPAIDRGFLRHFTWPVDAAGQQLQWTRLQVADKVWREHDLPALHSFKGGFIQEATGWKPSSYQTHFYPDQIEMLAGLR